MDEFRRMATRILLAVAFGAFPVVHAAVYKCQDASGKTTYSDLPCDSGAKPLRLGDGKAATDPRVCAQLLDELNRLAAEADRSAKEGRSQSGTIRRRQSLTKQYETRCVAISRSK